jgi:hypothetical protein
LSLLACSSYPRLLPRRLGRWSPQTTIRKATVSGTTARFKFTSSEKGAKFEWARPKRKFKILP